MGRLSLYANARGASAMHESGFSWLAAISLPVWALQRRLYRLAALSLLLSLGLGVLANRLHWSEGTQLVLFGLNFLASGLLAGRLQRWLLLRQGWVLTAEEPLPVDKAGS